MKILIILIVFALSGCAWPGLKLLQMERSCKVILARGGVLVAQDGQPVHINSVKIYPDCTVEINADETE